MLTKIINWILSLFQKEEINDYEEQRKQRQKAMITKIEELEKEKEGIKDESTDSNIDYINDKYKH